MSNCEGCGENISNEERRAGSTRYCIICEYIRPSTEERMARRIKVQAEQANWDLAMRIQFSRGTK